MKPTFTISKDKCSITCLKCGRTSHNLNDVKHRYCGHCHVFHEDIDWLRITWAGLIEKIREERPMG